MKSRVFGKSDAMKSIVIEGRAGRTSVLFVAFVALCLGLVSGCGNKFWDPTQVGRFRPKVARNVILDYVGLADEPPGAWEGGEEPLPIDLAVTESDYTLMSGDLVRITIFDLLREGVTYTNDHVVTETGKISVPEVDVLQAAGLTETQLEEEIKKVLSPSILKQPSVTVTLVSSQQRVFSINGDGVRFPNMYPIPRYDFRLSDALARAGGASQFNVSYIYVSRSVEGQAKGTDAVDPGFGELDLQIIEPEAGAPQLHSRQTLTPRPQHQWPRSKVVVASSEMISETGAVQPPKRSWQFNERTSTWSYGTETGDSAEPATPTGMSDEPASVNDVLKTLRDRSGSNRTSPRVGGTDSFESRRVPLRTDNRFDDRTRLGEPMRSPVGATTSRGAEGSMGQDVGGGPQWELRDGKWVAVPAEKAEPVKEAPTGHIEWVFRNGRYIPIQVGGPKPIEPTVRVQPEQPPGVAPGDATMVASSAQIGARTRLIRIPRLSIRDPQYNIVIKPGDSIFVPVDIVGECSVMGNVNRAGFINITGRPITLKQAIAAAGGLSPLAWPKRCEIVRRIGTNEEKVVRVDLDKIYSGEAPDFFIKPNDLINVGSHATARWRAVLRNAFRATYGFGFVYDRNFANKDFFGQTFNPITPWKWDKVF